MTQINKTGAVALQCFPSRRAQKLCIKITSYNFDNNLQFCPTRFWIRNEPMPTAVIGIFNPSFSNAKNKTESKFIYYPLKTAVDENLIEIDPTCSFCTNIKVNVEKIQSRLHRLTSSGCQISEAANNIGSNIIIYILPKKSQDFDKN